MSTPLVIGTFRNTAAGAHWSTSPTIKPGQTWVMHSGVWTPAKACQAAPAQRNTGTLTDPVWVEDWTLVFSDVKPTITPASVTVTSDDHSITENPGDPGKTAHVSWTNNGDPDYYVAIADWYKNDVLDSSTSAPTTNHIMTSPAIYHHEASDFSYSADQVHVFLRFVNPYASAPNQNGPGVTTSDFAY